MINRASWRLFLRRALRVLTVSLCVVLLAWLCLVWYINAHKEEIRARVTVAISEHLGGDLSIESMEPSLYRSFPDISLDLNKVSLRDSLWSRHRHSLLEAAHMYVRVNPFALLSQRTEIKKITAAHGSIFLYTDSTGYSNTYLLGRRDTTKKSKSALISRFGLDDMHFWFVNEGKRKLFHLYFKKLDGRAAQMGDVMRMHVKSSAHIHEFNFNITRGSYLHEQSLGLDLSLDYHLGEKRLEIPDQRIRIGGAPVNFGGNFFFIRSPASFAIRLHSPSIRYRQAVSWMSPNIRKRLDSFDFSKPLALDARISGVMKYRNVPLVNLSYQVKDNLFHTPYGEIEDISYRGIYTNEAFAGAGHTDENSRIAMYGLTGTWQKIPVQSDTLSITNLLRPIVKAHIRSKFEVPAINEIVGSHTLSFDKGTASADLRYEGGILPDDPSPYTIDGQVKLSNAGFTYLPRNLVFTNAAATLIFQGDNLFFRGINLRSKNSSISMEGEALHFLRLYFTDPGKVSINWKARAPLVNLNDFISFAGKRRTTEQRAPGKGIARIGQQLDRVLAASSVTVDAQLDRLVYKKFDAERIIARAVIAESGIVLQQVQISKGGGTLLITGLVNQSAPNNPFTLRAQVRNVDVARLFTSFDNFGQTAILAENLRGRVTADADIRGNVSDAGTILRNSLNGAVSFNLQDGQLRKFAPFEKVGRFAFKKRNLSEVNIKDLHGRFEIAGSKIYIPPMEIRTSVVNMNVQGVYGLQGGTDIYMEVPLRNPEKEEARTPVGMLLRKGKGFVLHLRAQDETGEGVRVGWDPRRKGRKATDEKLESQP